MTRPPRDTSLDTLLELNGQTLYIHEHYWVKFVVIAVEVTAERPHGLSYSLTLHEISGERIMGFDNAHPAGDVKGPGGKVKQRFDHKHRFKTVRPYEYISAASLLADFWTEVDAVLREKGVIP
jgi:hypothetical protein